MENDKKSKYVWPVDDEAAWDKKVAEAQRQEKELERIQKEDEASRLAWDKKMSEMKAEIKEIREKLNARNPQKEQKTKSKKEDTVVISNRPTKKQKRLGQTKLIDQLLKEGKSDSEIAQAVKEQIPQYFENKTMDDMYKLIKIRKYHVKK